MLGVPLEIVTTLISSKGLRSVPRKPTHIVSRLGRAQGRNVLAVRPEPGGEVLLRGKLPPPHRLVFPLLMHLRSTVDKPRDEVICMVGLVHVIRPPADLWLTDATYDFLIAHDESARVPSDSLFAGFRVDGTCFTPVLPHRWDGAVRLVVLVQGFGFVMQAMIRR